MAKRRFEDIALDLELFKVRKGKGVVHLTVQVETGNPVETLCERVFEANGYTVTDLDPTCAACLRRREDPARLSNAMFGQDLGSKLLELSLSRARKRPEDQQADDRAARAEPPRLRVVPAETGPQRPPAARAGEPAPPEPKTAPEEPLRPAGLDLARFEKVGRDQYRSPGGVMIRIVLRETGGWDVADVDYDGAARLEQLAGGRVRIKIGDLRFEYSGDFQRRVRLT